MVTSKKQEKSIQIPFLSPKLRLFFPKIKLFASTCPKPTRNVFNQKKKLVDIFFQTFSFHFIPICLYFATFFHCVNQQTKRVVRSPQLAQAISVFLCPSYVPAKCCSYQLLQGHRISVVRSRSMTEKMFKEATKTSVTAQSYGLACMTEICLKKPKCVCQTQQVRTRELNSFNNRPQEWHLLPISIRSCLIRNKP